MPVLYFVGLGSSLLSFFGCCYIIVTVLVFKALRTFMFRLIMYMALSNLITCFSLMIPYFESIELCKTQGFLLSFGSLSGLLWTAFIMYSLYQLIVNEKIITKKYEILANAVIWTVVSGTSAMGIQHFDANDGFCWISSYHYLYLMIIEFHGPFIIVLIFSLIICIKIWLYLKGSRESPEIISCKKSALKTFIGHPVILITCYTPVIIHRFFLQYFNGKFDDAFKYLTIIGDSIVGFCCFLIYANTKSVKSSVCHCSKTKPVQDISLLSSDNQSPY